MKKKQEWIAERDGIIVRVSNSYEIISLSDIRTSEQIWINGKLMMNRSTEALSDEELQQQITSGKTMTEILKAESQKVGSLYRSYDIDGRRVEILAGTSWWLFGTACQIRLDGERIGGDRIVLFVSRPPAER